MCGMMQMHAMPAMPAQPEVCSGLSRPVIPIGGDCQITQGPQQVVVEPAIVAAPNIFHHHQNVSHIQPVITQDIHNIHCHHKYVVQEQKKCDEVIKHAHGLCIYRQQPKPLDSKHYYPITRSNFHQHIIP